MKKIYALAAAIVALLTSTGVHAQMAAPSITDSVIAPYALSVTYYKTTNLVFPHAIKSVDRGSRDILAQKASGIENVLQVKAALDSLTETNLTVITADGRLYSFIVNYADTPMQLNLVFRDKDMVKASFTEQGDNAKALQDISKKAIAKRKVFLRNRDSHAGMELKLEGLYVLDDVYYFRFRIDNGSNVSFVTDAARFTVRDKQKSKRTASQETEMQPLSSYGPWETVKGRQGQYFVVAVPKFTLPDNKYLDIQVTEKDGGRDLQLKLKGRHVMKARQII